MKTISKFVVWNSIYKQFGTFLYKWGPSIDDQEVGQKEKARC